MVRIQKIKFPVLLHRIGKNFPGRVFAGQMRIPSRPGAASCLLAISATTWACSIYSAGFLLQSLHFIKKPNAGNISGQSGGFAPPGTINVTSYQFIQKNSSGQTPGCYGSGDAGKRSEHIRDSLNTGSGTIAYQDLNLFNGRCE